MAVMIIGGKEHERLEALFGHLAPYIKDKPIIVICPEQYTVETERLFINGLGLPGLLNIEVLSFKRLLHVIDGKTPGPYKVLMDMTGKTMLLRKALYSCQDQLELFKLLVNHGGFLEECATTIGYFKQNKVDPAVLHNTASSGPFSALLKLKIEEFSTIYMAYETLLQAGFYDEEAYFSDMLLRLKESSLFTESILCVVGFSSFNRLELEALSVLFDRVSDVLIELDGMNNGEGTIDSFRLMDKTQQQLIEALGESMNTVHHLERAMETDMDYFVRTFDVYPTPLQRGPVRHINIRAALNDEEEVEGVAVDILRRIRTEGYRYRDFAILMEDVMAYAPTIERIFKEYEIPHFLDYKRSVMHHSLSQFVLSLLRISLNSFERTDVLEQLKSGFYPLTAEQIGKFEVLATEEGLSGNDFALLGQDALMNHGAVSQVWENGLDTLVKWVVAYQNGGLQTELRVQMILDLFNTLKIPDQLANKIKWLKEKGEARLAYEEAQIYNAVLHVLDQQKNLLEGLDLDEKDFFDILKAGLSQLELATIPTQRDYITVGNLERSRLNEVKQLYILGANEGIIPPVIKAQDLFLNVEKEKLVDCGLELVGMEKDLDEQSAYNIAKALTTASEGLTLSFTFSDQEGTARRKSSVVERLTELFKDVEIKRFAPERINLEMKLKLRPALRQNMSRIRRHALENELTEQDFGFMKYVESQPTFKPLIHYQCQVLLGTEGVHRIEKAEASALYPEPLVASPTRLERFVRCPFQHFAQYGLRPQLVRESSLEQLEIGNYHHEILDRFSKHLIGSELRWQSITDVDIEDWMATEEMHFLSAKLRRLSRKKSGIAHAIKRLNQVGLRALKTAKRQFDQGKFSQYASELLIATQTTRHSIPPVSLKLSGGQVVLLEGKIDRVDIADIDGTYYTRIIDYKTGQKSFDLNDVYTGTALQLTLYMGALLDASTDVFGRAIEPAGIYYSKVDDPMVEIESGDEIDPENIEDQIFSLLKLSGLSTDQVAVLEAMDESLFDKGSSLFLPVALNKESTRQAPVFARSAQVLSQEDFKIVLKACKTKAQEVCEKIYAGEITPEPLLEKQVLSCEYCQYTALCGYDRRDPYSVVKKQIKRDKDQLLDLMCKEVSFDTVD